jgi:hypothetical protein
MPLSPAGRLASSGSSGAMTHARRMGQQGSQAMHACVHRDSCVMANHLPIPRCQPATRWVLDVSKTRLLNIRELHPVAARRHRVLEFPRCQNYLVNYCEGHKKRSMARCDGIRRSL